MQGAVWDFAATPDGQTRYVSPEFDPAIVPELEAWFARDSSIRFANFPVAESDLSGSTGRHDD